MQLIANTVNGAKVNGLKNLLSLYNPKAEMAATGQADLFLGGVQSKESIIREILEEYGYNTETYTTGGQRQSAAGEQRQQAESGGSEEQASDALSGDAADGAAGEVKPVGSGPFGAIYDNFRGKAKEAIAFLRRIKSGEVVGALHHKDIGEISIVWGNRKAGLEKILNKHPEVVDDLQEILDRMTIVEESDNRIKLESATHIAVVSREFEGTPRDKWLLTAYEKKGVSDGSIDIDSEPKKGKQNGTAPLQDTSSDGKDTKSSENGNIPDEVSGKPSSPASLIDEAKRITEERKAAQEAQRKADESSTSNEKGNSASGNTTDTDETLSGKRNGTATPQNTVSDGKSTNNSGKSDGDQGRAVQGSLWGDEEVQDIETRLVERRDKSMGLVPVNEIKSAEDITSNIRKIVEFLFGHKSELEDADSELSVYGGHINGHGHAYNAQKQVEQYVRSLNGVDSAITDEWKARSGIESSEALGRYVSELYAGQEKQAGKKKTAADRQGNPLNADGSLKVDVINSIDELTDEDFTNPTRNVQLPALPKNVSDAIGADGKPVVIKKNIFEKNAKSHRFTPEQSRDILNKALYNTELVGRTNPSKKQDYWVAIKIDDNSPIAVLEVSRNKDNTEVVGWYTLDDRNLERIKRQAERNGGELIILSKDKVESLSTPAQGLSSDGKGKQTSSKPQEGEKKNEKIEDVHSENLNAEIDKMMDSDVNSSETAEFEIESEESDREQEQTDERRLAYDAVSQMLSDAGVPVEEVSDETMRQMAEDASPESGDAELLARSNSPRAKWLNNYVEAVHLVTGESKKEIKRKITERIAEARREAKELYDAVLSGDFNSVTLQRINDYIDNATNRNRFYRPLSQRLPERALLSLSEGGRAGEVDALFSRICESSVPADGRTRAEARRAIEARKEELLEGWAKAAGYWHESVADFTGNTEPIGHGTDSDVYMSDDGATVIKASKGKFDNRKFPTDIDQVPLFNVVFPRSAYRIIGYGRVGGKFVKYLEQPYVDFGAATPLTADERVQYMHKLGFEPQNEEKTVFSNGDIVVSDLQKSNIVRDATGNVRVIDADVKLHTRDIGGNYTYPPVETDVEVPEFMTAYHGSGAKFDKFDSAFMGTGQGAQAYGWGHYVTEVESVGKIYANASTTTDTGIAYIKNRMRAGSSFEDARRTIVEKMENLFGRNAAMAKYASTREAVERLKNLTESDIPQSILYTIDIPEDTGLNYLPFDKAVPQKDVRRVLDALYDRLAADEESGYGDKAASAELRRELNALADGEMDGNKLYGTVSSYLGTDREASEFLGGLGYSGMKYPTDNKSGGNSGGRSNYVIFKDSDLKITDRVEFLRDGDVVYGAAVGGKIYLNADRLNPNTPVHEYTHLWDKSCKAKNPELWRRGVELMKQTSLWREVENDPNYAGLDEEGIASEVHARLTGEHGAELLERMSREALEEGGVIDKAARMSVISKLRKWLSDFWYWVKDTMTPWSREEADRVSLEDFVNMPLSDLARGTRFSENQYNAEEQSIIDNAKRDGTYMKAPNGKPTNLNERQWAQVRTKAFKQWFGDWEFTARAKAIESLEPIKVEAHSMARDELKEIYGNLPSVTKGDKKISFYGSAFGKNYRDGGLFAKAVPVLDNVLDNAVLAFSETDNRAGKQRPDGSTHKKHPNIDSYDNYVGKVEIDGKDYYVRFTVTNEKNQSGVHSQFVSDVTLYSNTATSLSGLDSSLQSRGTYDGIVDAKLADFLEKAKEAEENSSKVVDENGEPLVVYHGTNAEFSVFDPGKAGEHKCMYFSDSREMSGSYKGGDNLFEVFLNIRDGYEFDGKGRNWDDLRIFGHEPYEGDDLLKLAKAAYEHLRGDANAEEAKEKLGGNAYSRRSRELFGESALVRLYEEYESIEAIKPKNWLEKAIKRIRLSLAYRKMAEYKTAFAGWAKADAIPYRTSIFQTREIDRLFDDKDGIILHSIKDYGGGKVENRTPADVFVVYDANNIKSATANTGEFSTDDNDIRFSIVTDKKEIERLNSEPTIKVYRAMQLRDGVLYPPMAGKVNGKWQQGIAVEDLGKLWEKSDEHPELVDEKGNFKLNKGNGKALNARYNPYFHTSTTPLNDQFASAQSRPELVTVEVEVPESELTSGYKAEKAKDSVGKVEWKAGVVQGKLSGTRTVILSRWDKPVRIVPESEVADRIVEMFGGREITMPSNVVTPALREELEKRGIPFVETDNQGVPVEEAVRFREDNPDTAENSQDIEKVNAKFNEQLGSLTEENADRVILSLGTPSDILLSAGVEDKPMKLYGNKVMKKMRKHGFTLGELRDLPRAVADPIAVFNNYGKDGNRSILTEMRTRRGNFLVSVNIGKDADIDFNIVRSVFGKGNESVVDWINKGFATYINKKKTLDYLHFSESSIPEASNNREGEKALTSLSHQSAPIAATAANAELSSAAKVVENFENPSVAGENQQDTELEREGERSYDSVPTSLSRSQSGKRHASEEMSRAVGVPVEYVSRDEMPENHRNAKGYWQNGKIYVCLENHPDADDVRRTVLHEAVGHNGLRRLVGDGNMDAFCMEVFAKLPKSERAVITEAALRKYRGQGGVRNHRAQVGEYARGHIPRPVRHHLAVVGREDGESRTRALYAVAVSRVALSDSHRLAVDSVGCAAHLCEIRAGQVVIL